MSIKSLAFDFCPAFLRPTIDRIENSPLGYRLARGVFWMMAGAMISRGLTLAASILVARMLGRAGYGELGMIQSTVVMFGVFADFGLGLTATRHIAELRQSDPQRAGRVMALSGLFAIVTGSAMALGLWVFAPWLAEHSINAPHLAGPLRVGALILFASVVNSAQTGALAGFEAFKTVAKVNLGVGLASFPLLVSGAYYGGLMGAVWALAVNMGVNWLLNHLALRREAARCKIDFTLAGCFQEWSVLWKFSLPAAMGAVLAGPVLWLCNALLVIQPDGYDELGIFNAANQWRTAILFIPNMVGSVGLPMLSSLCGRDNHAKYLRVFKINVAITGGIALVVATGVALASPWIMQSYGPGFEQGFDVLVCLAFSTVLAALKNVLNQAIISRGRMWVVFGFNVIWALTLLSVAFALVRSDCGAMGLACANLTAYLLHDILQGVYMIPILRGVLVSGSESDVST